MLLWASLRHRLTVRSAKRRLRLATRAERMMSATKSELAIFGLLSVVALIAAVASAFGATTMSEFDDRLFAAALSLACFFNFTLFFARFEHFAAIVGDIDRIDALRSIVRDGPPVGHFMRMKWDGQRPANDF
jgi:hypothetical protein